MILLRSIAAGPSPAHDTNEASGAETDWLFPAEHEFGRAKKCDGRRAKKKGPAKRSLQLSNAVREGC
jgi:hypothetical protein